MKNVKQRTWPRRALASAAALLLAVSGAALGAASAAANDGADSRGGESQSGSSSVRTVSAVKVVDQHGNPLQDVGLSFSPENGGGWGYGVWGDTDASGVSSLVEEARAESLGVPGVLSYSYATEINSNYVGFYGYWDGKQFDATERVQLGAGGETLELRLELPSFDDPSDFGTVSGTLSLSTGSKLGYPYGYLNRENGDYFLEFPLLFDQETGYYEAVTYADADVPAQIPAGTYQIRLGHYIGDGEDTAAPWGYATHEQLITIAAGQAVTHDAVLDPLSKISGSVSEIVDGAAVPNDSFQVWAKSIDHEWYNTDWGSEQSNGQYEILLPPGSYTVSFADFSSSYGPTGYYETDFWQHYDRVDDIKDATLVTVTPTPREITGINALKGANPAEQRVVAGQVAILGDTKIGETLTVDAGTWEPSDVELSYQWSRDGQQIPGATGTSYTLTEADLGFRISVTVSGTKSGYTPDLATATTADAVRDGDPAQVVLTVESESGSPIAGAAVYLYNQNGNARFDLYGTSAADGTVTIAEVPRGDYTVEVYPSGSDFRSGSFELLNIVAGENRAATLVLGELRADLPPSVTLLGDPVVNWDGLYSFYAGETVEFEVEGAPNAVSASFAVVGNGPSVEGELNETEAGVYRGSFVAPNWGGQYTVKIALEYADGTSDEVEFDIYIDPAGTVLDRSGAPIEGATATLLRSDTEHGAYEQVADGSDIMSPRNRVNPFVTGADGAFSWDTVPGWYKVVAEKDGVRGETEALPVPPEQLGLRIVLDLPGELPAPIEAPSVSGEGKVGAVLTANPGIWPAVAGEASPLEVLGYQWTRNGEPIPGATSGSYTVTAADAGARIGLTLSVGRDGFTPFVYAVAGEVRIADAPIDQPDPSAPDGKTPEAGDKTPGAEGELQVTGSNAEVPLVVGGIAFALLLAGAAVLLVRRKTQHL